MHKHLVWRRILAFVLMGFIGLGSAGFNMTTAEAATKVKVVNQTKYTQTIIDNGTKIKIKSGHTSKSVKRKTLQYVVKDNVYGIHGLGTGQTAPCLKKNTTYLDNPKNSDGDANQMVLSKNCTK